MKISALEALLKDSRIQLEKELEGTKYLQSISTELIRGDNIQILFEKIIDVAMQIMNSQYASMQMLHTNKGNLQLLAFRGFNEKAAKFWQWVSVEEAGSTCGEALRKGCRVIVPNVKECDFMQGTEDRTMYLQTGINAVQSTPLYSRSGKLIGMISTHWSEIYHPSERELRFFDVLARQVADLIEQKQYEDKLREREERYRTLFEYTNDGFFLAKIILDNYGKPIDYIHLAINPAFESIIGLKRKEVVGKSRYEVAMIPSQWFGIFSTVALTGKSTTFEGFSEVLNRHLLIKAFSPKHKQFACLVQDITERKEVEEKIKWDKERAEILYEVTEKLLASVRPQEIVEELCVRVMRFLECDVFVNYLIDEEKMKLCLNSYAGIPRGVAKEIQWLDYGVAVCGCVAQDASRIVADKIQTTCDPRTNLIKSFGINAYACHPLMEQNKVIGTLSFGTKSKETFNEDEIDLMKAVSNQVSIAMSRMRTEQVMKRQQQLMIKAESEKREALEKTMEIKDEFLSLISHELRTPINVINAATQALNFIYANEMSDKVKEYIKTIKQNNFRQLRLVNNLLDITHVNSGHIKINKKNIDIVFLTRAITESVYQYASQKGVEIKFVSSFDEKIIGVDDEKYERIILNLLSNAIKFTPKGKSVRVSLSSKKDSIGIEVKDRGIGIPENKIDVIFERFGQVDSSLSRQAEGTGIGLSLVKNFVEALDGRISVKSKLGKGSSFIIELPMKQVVEEEHEKPTINLINDRLIHVTNVEFSDIYL